MKRGLNRSIFGEGARDERLDRLRAGELRG
jgi:hypothetical protein